MADLVRQRCRPPVEVVSGEVVDDRVLSHGRSSVSDLEPRLVRHELTVRHVQEASLLQPVPSPVSAGRPWWIGLLYAVMIVVAIAGTVYVLTVTVPRLGETQRAPAHQERGR